MTSITQDMRYRVSLIKYAEKYGVSKAALKYKTNRQYIYRWKNRYNGSCDSLRDRSRRPHSHPNQHTHEEIKLIRDMRCRNPNAELVVFGVKLMQKGYKRSKSVLYRFLKNRESWLKTFPLPNMSQNLMKKIDYPKQWIQIDVKFIPSVCLVNEAEGQRFYQYTALDEYSPWRHVKAFEEYSSTVLPSFWNTFQNASRFLIECVQTDNGAEFTKRFSSSGQGTPTRFQRVLSAHGIRHKLIRPFTPRHNGKMERSHRKDNENFYASHTFYSFKDFYQQLQRYNRRDYNHFPIRPLGWKPPQKILAGFKRRV